jgi:serine/threonine protein kinase/tetratricopeptide (TPR) repeat protein
MAIECPKCHTQNTDDSKFCKECTAPLKPADDSPLSHTKTVITPQPQKIDKDTLFAGRYRIIEELGKGGMGVVVKAEDTRLKRIVALKFLPPELTRSDEARERFIQEAQAASKLDHPNICTIHEIDETEDEKVYIAMACYEGQSLKEKIARGLKQEEAVDMAIQAGEGLVKSHSKGIVHRDIKPANIFVTTDGIVKILDFGLAKLSGQVGLTRTGTTMGTVAYMSPEQARGQEVDHRADIWSLGVVLYEMLTGELPFKGENEQSVIYSILNEDPAETKKVVSGAATDLDKIIFTALAKNPKDRYQKMEDLVEDLKTVSQGLEPVKATARPQGALRRRKKMMLYGGAAGLLLIMAVLLLTIFVGSGQAIDSIAVLPLDNLSGNPDQEYFSDGITDALISELAQIRALHVISRQSVMQYKGSTKALPEIAKELNVRAVVEASVLTAGSKVRINAKLVKASTDQTLWAQSYEREIVDILVLQSEVAQTIAQEIKVEVTPEEETRLASARVVDAEAHKAYLKGRYFLDMMTPESINKSIEYFQQSIDIDPEYAPPHAGLSDACFHLVDWVITPTETSAIEDAMKKSKEAARRALEIDETLSEAHTSMASARLFYDWDWAGAEASYKKAIELNPGDARAHMLYSQFFSFVGRHREAVEVAKRAEELVPLSPLTTYYVAQAYFMAREYDQSVEQIEKALEFDPNFILALNLYGYIYWIRGQYKDTLAMWGKMHDITGRKELSEKFFAVGDDLMQAMRTWLELSETPGASFCLRPTTYSFVYLVLEDMDMAFHWLEKAYTERDTAIVFINMDPSFDYLRSDPRFQDMLRQMNFPD